MLKNLPSRKSPLINHIDTGTRIPELLKGNNLCFSRDHCLIKAYNRYTEKFGSPPDYFIYNTRIYWLGRFPATNRQLRLI